jgi:succinoglycan biosynthesis transport protein ExoP
MQNHANGLTHATPAPLGSHAPMSSLRSPEFFPELPGRELTLKDLWGVLMRRKGIILAVTLAIFALAALYCATTQRLYKATATIQVQKDSADALSLDQMMGPTETAGDAVESSIALQTEALILQSDSLALSVIQTLNLEHTPDFHGGFSLLGWLMKPFMPAGIVDAANVPLDQAPGRRTHVIKTFEGHLKVKPLAGTRLISIEYLSTSPRTAAAVVNLLVKDLQDYNFSTKHDATQQASIWLGTQLSDLRQRSEDLQAKVVALQRNSGIFTMGQTDSQGREQTYTPTLDRLQQATSQLGQAESARIMKGALYNVVKDGNPELISSLAGNSTLSGSSSGLSNSLTLLQNLRANQATKQAEVDQLSSKFGPAYPELIEAQASLDTTRKAIAEESARIAARVKNDYLVSQQVETNDQAVFEQLRSQAQSLNSKAVEYEIAQQEATQSSNLYQNLLQRMKEADLVAGLHSSNITLVDPGRVPARPARPNIPITMAGALAAGFILGICAALLREATDERIQNLDEFQNSGPEMPLAFLPYHASSTRKRLAASRSAAPSIYLPEPLAGTPSTASLPEPLPSAMIAASAPRAAYTEALRSLRTTLMQRGYRDGHPPQVMVITSSVPGEGKSMLSINLAIVYAQRGKRVLLVDGDLRTPVLHQRLALSNERGLGDLLTQRENEAGLKPQKLMLDARMSLDVIAAGSPTSYPTELLASEEMEALLKTWRASYDYIFVDGAPLLPVTDSAVLSRYADFTLVVARHNVTDRRLLERTCHILRSQGIRNSGVVLNGVRMSGAAQYRYYGLDPKSYYERELHA